MSRKFLRVVKLKRYSIPGVILLSVLLVGGGLYIYMRQAAARAFLQASQGAGILIYSQNTTTPQYRKWVPGSTAIGSETATASSQNAYQSVVVNSPTVVNEWFAAVNDNGGNLQILRSTDDGTTWSSSLAAATIGAIGGTGTTRRFDIAYEGLSGDLVLAYSKNATTNEIGTRRWDASSLAWQSEATFDPGGTSTVVSWIELAEYRSSDEIALGYVTIATSGDNIGAAIWSGSSNALGNATAAIGMCDQTAGTPDGVDKCMDVNYESASGRPVMSWGIASGANAANTIRGSRWDGSAWTTNTITLGATGDDATWVDCESNPDPESADIACGSFGASAAGTQAWAVSGGTLYGTAGANIDTTAHAASTGHAYVATMYLQDAGGRRAIVFYAENTAANSLHYTAFNGSTWAAATSFAPTYSTQEESIVAATNRARPSEGIVYVADASNDLYATRVSIDSAGTITRVNADSSATLENTLPATQGYPMSFAFEPYRIAPVLTQSGYIWENEDDSSNAGVNDENTALAAANSSISVPKGTKVTLRMQVKNTGGAAYGQSLGLFYDRYDDATSKYNNQWAKVESHVKPKTSNGSGCTSTQWTCGQVNDYDVGLHNSIAMDSQGLPWIAYRTDYTGGGGIQRLKVAHYTGHAGDICVNGPAAAGWSCIVVENTGTNLGVNNSIAIDRQDNPWVAYYDTPNTALKAARFVGSGGTGCNTVTWTCETVDNNGDMGSLSTEIIMDTQGNPWISYFDAGNANLLVARYVGANGTGCTSTAWTCVSVDGASTSAGHHSSLALGKDGRMWVSFTNLTNTRNKVGYYVGAGGTGCSSAEWQCQDIDDVSGASGCSSSQGNIRVDGNGNPWIFYHSGCNVNSIARYVGGGSGSNCTHSSDWNCEDVATSVGQTNNNSNYVGLAFDPNGNAYMTYEGANFAEVNVARYVGTGGTGCNVTTWTCVDLDNSSNRGFYSDIAFDPSGIPWVSYNQAGGFTPLWYAKLDDRAGELIVSPAQSAARGDVINETHADMTTTSDDSNRNDNDCIGGGGWATGGVSESPEYFLNMSGGTAGYCTEVSYTIDTSQAVVGRTYRLALSSRDYWDPDRGVWRPMTYSQMPTITVTTSDMQVSKDVMPKFANCGGSSTWGCIELESDGNTAWSPQMAFDPDGVPWTVAYNFDGVSSNRVALNKYVGTGGTGCATGVTNWTCTQITSASSHHSYDVPRLQFDAKGNPWVIANDGAQNPDMLVSIRYVGKNGTGCGSDILDYQCANIDATGTSGVIYYTDFAVDKSGNAWIVYDDVNTGSDKLKVAHYVGSGGTGCSATTEWACYTLRSDITGSAGAYANIAIDNNGLPWVSASGSSARLEIARYVGNGGSGCDSTAWTCTAVDTTSAAYSSIAFDSTNTPWISWQSGGGANAKAGKYVGGASGTGCSNTAWSCKVVDDTSTHASTTNSIAIDAHGYPWVAFTDTTPATDTVRVNRYVATGGTGCAAGVTDWTCFTVDAAGTAATGTKIAFDDLGVPWVSYKNVTGSLQRIAKMHLPFGQPVFEATHYRSPRSNARRNIGRYTLNPGSSPNTLAMPTTCGGVADRLGMCGLYGEDGQYDTVTAQKDEQPIYQVTAKFPANTELPTFTWAGCSTLAPSTGNIILQVYRYGSTNDWETINTDSGSGDCTGAPHTVSAMPSGTVTDYFRASGSEYMISYRMYQVNSTASFTLKTDYIVVKSTTRQMRNGRTFVNEKSTPLRTR